MIIRTGTEPDYALLDGIEARSDRTYLKLSGFEEAVNAPRLANDLGPDRYPGSMLFIAETDAPIGFAYVRDLDDCVHINQVSVVPEAQGQGAGTGLLEAAAAAAVRRSRRGLTLTTFAEVPWNAPFYQRRGFHILDDTEMGPDLRATFASDVRHMSRYGARCAMGRFFAPAE